MVRSIRKKFPLVKEYVRQYAEYVLTLDTRRSPEFEYIAIPAKLIRRFRNVRMVNSAVTTLERIGWLTRLHRAKGYGRGGIYWYRIRRIHLRSKLVEYRRVRYRITSIRSKVTKKKSPVSPLRNPIQPPGRSVPKLSGPQLLRQLLRHADLDISPREIGRIEIRFVRKRNPQPRVP